MSNRRYSIAKLSVRLRILESDLIELLDKHGVVESTNTHGYNGYDPVLIQDFLNGLDTFSKNQVFLLKARWEQEQERNSEPLEDYFSLDEVAELFDIPKRKASQFLNANNVRKVIKNGYTFWDAVTILKIKSSPSKKQSTDLNKIKSSKVSQSHLKSAELADLLEIPEELLPRWKRTLHIENIYPLTRDTVLDLVSSSDYSSKLERFLARENKKEADRVQKIKEERELLALHKKTIEASREDDEILDGIPADKMFSATQSATILGVSAQVFRKFIKNNSLTSDSFYTNKYKQRIDLFSYRTVYSLKDDEALLSSRLRSSRAKNKLRNKQESLRTEKDSIVAFVQSAVVVNVRDRTDAPHAATLYVGPTNSGKTYNALNALYAEYEANPEGVYVYAGPLRMLAYEVYLKMCEKYGEDSVGFITGEEQINPEAPLLATTAEMAPSEGTSLVLDEAHWIIEPARGHNWTNLLVGGKYENLHILTAAEAKDNIKELIDDAYHVEERAFTRKTPISYGGMIIPAAVGRKTAVICFSRKMVYKVAKTLSDNTNLKVGVLYGALPLLAREKQINDFINGEMDIIVTTDVIGHGINLPLDNVVYAETSKFDGQETRELRLWEAAQISGRAGRFGLSKEGRVYGLDLGWNKVDSALVQRSALAAGGKIGTGLKVNNALIAPRLGDLGITKSDHLLLAMETWKSKAATLLKERSIAPADLKEPIALLEAVATSLSAPLYPWDTSKDERDYGKNFTFGEAKPLYPKGRALTAWNVKLESLWQLTSGPFDSKLPTISIVANWLQNNKKDNLIEQFYVEEVANALNSFGHNLEVLEKLARIVSELKMIDIIFPYETGLDTDQLGLIEHEISTRIIDKLSDEIDRSELGNCKECDATCSPRFSFCDDCYAKTKKWQIAYS
jgi:ATP-dependent RNA helicase SUPV3L1/SUV3